MPKWHVDAHDDGRRVVGRPRVRSRRSAGRPPAKNRFRSGRRADRRGRQPLPRVNRSGTRLTRGRSQVAAEDDSGSRPGALTFDPHTGIRRATRRRAHANSPRPICRSISDSRPDDVSGRRLKIPPFVAIYFVRVFVARTPLYDSNSTRRLIRIDVTRTSILALRSIRSANFHFTITNQFSFLASVHVRAINLPRSQSVRFVDPPK